MGRNLTWLHQNAWQCQRLPSLCERRRATDEIRNCNLAMGQRKTYEIGIGSGSCGISKNFLFGNNRYIWVIVLEPGVGWSWKMPGVEKIMTPGRRRATVDEDRSKLVGGFCTILPYWLELTLQNIHSGAEAINFRADLQLLLIQLLKKFVVNAWYRLILQLCQEVPCMIDGRCERRILK